MAFDPSGVPTRLVDAARRRTLVPFIGSGISRQAGDQFPNWRALLHMMKARAVEDSYINPTEEQELNQLLDKGQYLMVAEHLRYELPTDEYETILVEQFDPPGARPAEIHRALFRLRPNIILTTNYDRLLENAYAATYQEAVRVATYRDVPDAQRLLQSGVAFERPIIFKMHGTIDAPDGIILTERDYRELIYRQPGYRLFISALFLTQVVLMLGFSLNDPELRLQLESIREALKHRSSPDYIFLPRNEMGTIEARRLREDFGVQAIPYDPTSGQPEVLEFVNFLAAHVDQNGVNGKPQSALVEPIVAP